MNDCQSCGRYAASCNSRHHAFPHNLQQCSLEYDTQICQLLKALRTLRPTLGSEDERQRRQLTVQMSQHALIDLCKNESQKHLIHGQYELAIPGALQSLRFSIEVYGAGRIELVPAYLLVCHVCMIDMQPGVTLCIKQTGQNVKQKANDNVERELKSIVSFSHSKFNE